MGSLKHQSGIADLVDLPSPAKPKPTLVVPPKPVPSMDEA